MAGGRRGKRAGCGALIEAGGGGRVLGWVIPRPDIRGSGDMNSILCVYGWRRLYRVKCGAGGWGGGWSDDVEDVWGGDGSGVDARLCLHRWHARIQAHRSSLLQSIAGWSGILASSIGV